MTELDETTFEPAIAGAPLLVDFWAPWCRPCKALEPILEELPSSRAVNIDEEPGIASRYDVLSIPTVSSSPVGSRWVRGRAAPEERTSTRG